MIVKKILIFSLILVALLSACSSVDPNMEGKVVDKIVDPGYVQYINTGNNVNVPIFHSDEYYLVVEDNDNGKRERVSVKDYVFDNFDEGDEIIFKDKVAYKDDLPVKE
ncbi:hypothetical protein [Staphylococcus phage vB_StaM_SA1]|nr:hypothetical protein [Staphylococcus phage vB_StaM_SA1]